MERVRAEEIASSGDMKFVSYNGKKVYIQHVNEDADTARVYYLDEPQNEFDVQLASLQEKH